MLRQVGRTQAPFIVAKGEFEVIQGGGRHGPKSLALIRSGSVFGEQTFFEGVHALADGEVLALIASEIDVPVARNSRFARSILFDIGRILSLRLRQTTQLMHGTTD